MKNLMTLKLFKESKYIKNFEFVLNNTDDIDLKYLEIIKDFKLNNNTEKFVSDITNMRNKYPDHESSISKLALNIWFNEAL